MFPSKREIIRRLEKEGFSPDTIRQVGARVLYRDVLASKSLGRLEQMGLLKCDADSQDPTAAREDLKDLMSE